MTRKQKTMLIRVILSGLLLAVGFMMDGKTGYSWIPFIVSYVAAGYDIPLRALRNIRNGQVFDENFLMTIATFGAIAVGSLEEAVAVMLFYQVGEWFNDYAVNKSRKSITALMDINPEYANRLTDGVEERVDPDEVEVEDVIVVKPGEKVPLDGVILKGESSLDTKALTGESMPAQVKAGMDIISGSINLSGVLTVRVTKVFDDSTVAKILELVESASEKKAKTENFITKFARIYTPIVVVLAFMLAVLPPLLAGQEWSVWIYRACSFLVVSCPCALVISVPLSFFGGLGAASKQGILMKGSNYLEAVSTLDTVVFDKTGTLTTGKFRVTDVFAAETEAGGGDLISREELLKLAAYGEFHSNHPIAWSVKEAYGNPVDQNLILSVEETAGQGIHTVLNLEDGKADVYIGNETLMKHLGIELPEQELKTGTTLYLAKGKRFLGSIVIADTIREDVPQALKGLRREGVKNLVMLTGDKVEVAKAVAGKLGLNQFFGGLLPGDKVQKVEELLSKKEKNKTLAFVGDGINDAPVLARADVGIAMGGIGSDAAVEAADMVIMTDEPSRIVDGIRIARRTMRIVKQNIVFAIGVKVLVLALVAVGFASMWGAVFADVGVSVLAILNAVGVLNYKKISD